MKISDKHFGKKIRCTGCKAVLVISDAGKVTKAIPAEEAAAPNATKSTKLAPSGDATKSAKPAAAPAKKSTKAAPGAAAESATASAKKSSKAAAPSAPKRAGKGEMKRANEVVKKKEVKLNPKLKGKALGRVSVKDRMEALDADKGTRRLWALGGFVMVAAVIAVVVIWMVTTKNEVEKPPDAPPIAVTPSMAKGTSVTVDTTDINDRTQHDVDIWIRSTDGMEFVQIPAGEYTVGCARQDQAGAEVPETKVTVKEYFIGRNEITNKQYRTFITKLNDIDIAKRRYELEADTWEMRQPDYASGMRAKAAEYSRRVYDHPLQPKNKTNHLPKGTVQLGARPDAQACYGVDWYDAYAYQNWANGMDPKLGILPTEVEWEIAARGKKGYLYPWGSSETELAQVIARSADAGMEPPVFIKKYYGEIGDGAGALPEPATGAGGAAPAPAPANSFGLQNICGNAAELCWDRWAGHLYRWIDKKKTTAFSAGPADFNEYRSYDNKRAFRFSSVAVSNDHMDEMRYTRREGIDPYHPVAYISFRCVYYPEGRGSDYQAEIDACYTPDPTPTWTLPEPREEGWSGTAGPEGTYTVVKREGESKGEYMERVKLTQDQVGRDREVLASLQEEARKFATAKGHPPTVWELADLTGKTRTEVSALIRDQPSIGAPWFRKVDE
ncbi:MAG: formylglycine-generating enzyme family protein [Planctomycetota bacterium]